MSQTAEALRPILEIMRRHGAQCTAEEFHAAVNVAFHNFESEVYDQVHADMWDSLPQQFDLFADDVLHSGPAVPASLSMLDIGCGTGLASHCILQSALGARVSSVNLLDTSPSMLAQAQKRANEWKVPVKAHLGLIETLSTDERYDLIVTCSVLHHVPDLAQFLDQVRVRQAHGGFFIHLQDPNGDFATDPELKERMAQIPKSRLPERLSRFAPRRVLGRLYRELTSQQGRDHVSKTNRSLLESGIVRTPLTPPEIYAITDIHVDDGLGISIERMKSWMPDYDCVSCRSYGFFGRLWSTLPPDLKGAEEDLIQRKAQNGLHVGAAWRLHA